MPASAKACSKARRWESVSTVEPDFDETTTTVLLRSPASAARTWSGWLESSTVRSTPSVAQMTSGRQRGAAHAAEHDAGQRPPRAQASTMGRKTDSSGRDASGSPTQARRLDASSSASGPHSVGSLGEEPAGELLLDEARHVLGDGPLGLTRRLDRHLRRS